MILIKNGRVMDPATGLNGLFDVLIDGERIAKIGMCGSLDDMAMESAGLMAMGGEEGTESVTEIDASGCVVAPGLVDGREFDS